MPLAARARPAPLATWSRLPAPARRARRVAAHDVAHHEKHREQDHHDEKTAEQLLVAQHQFEFASFVVLHELRRFGRVASRLLSARSKDDSISIGSGKTMVVFFSVPISTSVCR